MLAKGSLYFFFMNSSYFQDYGEIDEFQTDIQRGHGVTILEISPEIMVAIPMRSSLRPYMKNQRHLFPYKVYEKEDGNEALKALDFSKLTIIDEKYIDKSTTYFFQDDAERSYYLENFDRISTLIKNYINSYIRMCETIKKGEGISISYKKNVSV